MPSNCAHELDRRALCYYSEKHGNNERKPWAQKHAQAYHTSPVKAELGLRRKTRYGHFSYCQTKNI